MTVEMDTERTRARHRDKTQDVFAEESEALDQIAKQVIISSNSDTGTVQTKSEYKASKITILTRASTNITWVLNLK